MKFLNLLFIFYLFFSFIENGVVYSEENNFYPNEENCGLRDEIPGDSRTSAPWTVTIFKRTNLTSPYKYFITAGITTSTAIFTIFGGGYGQPYYKDPRKEYYIPPSSHFLVAAGLKSTDINDKDEFTQFSNVTYIFPFKANSSGNEEYHMVMFRLVTPLKLQTPYVRAACQPFYLLPALESMGIFGRFSDIFFYDKNVEPSFASGHIAPLNSTGPHPVTFLSAQTSNDRLCLDTYKYYYRSEPDEIFCLIVPPAEGVSQNNCLTHGTTKLFQSINTVNPWDGVRPALSPKGRFYTSGAISLIPRKGRGQCDINTLYYVVNIWSATDWVKRNMLCGPNTYPCKDGRCIPLDQVCDGKADCSVNSETLGEDEDPIFCAATKRCKDPKSYQCGLEGECIHVDKIGDGVEDCPSGSDEDSRLLEIRNRGIEVRKGGFCEPISPSQGVIVTCSHPQLEAVDCNQAPPGTVVSLSCDKFYKSSSKTKFVTMKCYNDNTWKPFRDFLCERECGIVHIDPKKAPSTRGHENFPMSFPWHALILKKNEMGNFEHFCGASLIERNILITSGSCTTDEKGVPYDVGDIKVTFSLTPSRSSIKEWETDVKSFYKVKEIRKPETYDAKILQSDIAIIILDGPVTYTDTINPICYLYKKYKAFPPTGATGSVPRSGESKAEEGSSLKYMDVTVDPRDKCGRINDDKFCGKYSQHEISASEDICEGQSGSGLVFLTQVQDDFRTFLLKGVVSKPEKTMGSECSENSVVSFTHLDYHSEWLLRNLQNFTTIGV